MDEQKTDGALRSDAAAAANNTPTPYALMSGYTESTFLLEREMDKDMPKLPNGYLVKHNEFKAAVVRFRG